VVLVSSNCEEFWASVPTKAEHPIRVPILEAFRWVGEPLLAIDLADVFDGKDITMWEAAHHLRILDALDVVKPYPARRNPLARPDGFDLPYHLAPDIGEGG
jgi:hypothetical protein